MPTINTADDQLLYYWQHITRILKHSPLDKHAFVLAAADFMQAIDYYAAEKNDEFSPDLIMNAISMCMENIPCKLRDKQIVALKQLSYGLTDTRSSIDPKYRWLFWSESNVSKETNAKSTYQYLDITIASICSAVSNGDADVDNYETEMQDKILDYCMKENDAFQPLLNFIYEEKFIHLAHELMHLICLYVFMHPDQTLAHNRHKDCASLLEFTNDLLINRRELPSIKRSVMLLSRLATMDQYNKGEFKQIIESIKKSCFGNDNVAINDPHFLTKFSLHYSFYKDMDKYKPYSHLSSQHIEKKRNTYPYDAIKQHLTSQPEKLSFFKRLINWFYSIVRVHPLQKEIMNHGFFKNKQHKFSKKLPTPQSGNSPELVQFVQ